MRLRVLVAVWGLVGVTVGGDVVAWAQRSVTKDRSGTRPASVRGTSAKPASDEPADEKDATEPDEKAKEEPSEGRSENEPPQETEKETRVRLQRRAVLGYGSPTNLLSLPQIQTELQLTNKQHLELRKIQSRMANESRAVFSQLQDLPPDVQRARIGALRQQVDGRLADKRREMVDLLTKDQQRRLQGISLQVRGSRALIDPELCKLLDLTDEQIEELLALSVEYDRKIQALIRSRPAERSLITQRIGMLQAELGTRLLAILTEEQVHKYEELKGETFELPASEVPASTAPPRDEK